MVDGSLCGGSDLPAGRQVRHRGGEILSQQESFGTVKMASRALILTACFLAGCSAAYYTDQADREVSRIVTDKTAQAFGQPREFSIVPGDEFPELLEGVGGPPAAPPPSAADNLPPALPEPPADAVRLSVADALRVAVHASRNYQTQKETVYLTALALTFQRYLFDPHPSWTGATTYVNNDLGQADLRRSRAWDLDSEVGVSQTLADGMLVTGTLGLAALKFLNKELGDTVDSALNVTVSQPLWRGAGRKVVQENFLQAERNALYAVRTFARFEQTFAVTIATRYLRVLQQRDVVLNEWRNYRTLLENREQAEWMSKAERMPEFQVDQARQDELRAYNRWIVARESYENAVDAFKILLGVPVAYQVVLDPGELDRLAALGLQPPDLGLDDAVAKAVEGRFDLVNSRDGLEDAERKIVVAENGLAGDVDLVASIGYQSSPGPPQSAYLRFNRGNYSVGLAIDMPIDRLQERNALRETQISRDQARRALDEFQDEIVLEVRTAFRRLEQTQKSYEIQKQSVELAERRVESTQLLLQAGRATQRDVLEAQQALVEAKNALTAALVDHTVAGLEFGRDAGTLVVNQEGQIHGWNLTDSGDEPRAP